MSLGPCSPSNNSQSKPAPALISAETALASACQRPICGTPALRAALKPLIATPKARFLSQFEYERPGIADPGAMASHRRSGAPVRIVCDRPNRLEVGVELVQKQI